MAIRIRKVGNKTIALCAVESDEKEGDIYLDDAAHNALSTKFALDDVQYYELVGDVYRGDPELIKLMEKEKVRDAEEEFYRWIKEQENIKENVSI